MRYRLPNGCSIYTAELAAIYLAILWIAKNAIKNYRVSIISDSQLVPLPIKNRFSIKNPSLLDNKLHKIHMSFFQNENIIYLTHIFFRVNTKENNIADKLANSARSLLLITYNYTML